MKPTSGAIPRRCRGSRAFSADDVRSAQRLRFEVFDLELGESLAESYATGLDVDPFDECCDHLIVEEAATGEVVGPSVCLGWTRQHATGSILRIRCTR